MFYFISKILWLIVNPAGILFIIPVAAVALHYLGYRKLAWRALLAMVVLMAVIWLTPFDTWLMRPIETRFPVPPAPPCADGVVVLGGGEGAWQDADGRHLELGSRPMRYVVLSELMRRYPAARVIFAGGGVGGIPNDTDQSSESAVARNVMERLGMNVGRVAFDSRSRTTWENAKNAYDLATPKPGERWILVTGAMQMARAVGSFRQLGWRVLPWPTDFESSGSFWFKLGALGPLTRIDDAEHEWLGLIAYWLTGRSSELLPGPDPALPATEACPA